MSYTPPAGDAADVSWVGAAAYTAPGGAAADFDFSAGLATQARMTVPGPLGAPAVLATSVRLAWASAPSMLGSPAVLGTAGLAFFARASAPSPLGSPAAVAGPVAVGWAAAPGPLGAAAVLAQQPVHGRVVVPSVLGVPAVMVRMPMLATASAPTMLGAAQVLAYHDFTVGLGDVLTRYVLDLVTPTGTVRVPMSSWQATLQTGRSNFVQAVVPAVLDWVTSINAATEFAIVRTASIPGGGVIEYEMARAPLGEARFDRGPNRYTCTLTGYSDGFAVDETPVAATDRTLQQVRSVSSGSGGVRVRCAIDWLLRPGQRALVDGVPFTVAYINYYVNGNDAYMDCGERN